MLMQIHQSTNFQRIWILFCQRFFLDNILLVCINSWFLNITFFLFIYNGVGKLCFMWFVFVKKLLNFTLASYICWKRRLSLCLKQGKRLSLYNILPQSSSPCTKDIATCIFVLFSLSASVTRIIFPAPFRRKEYYFLLSCREDSNISKRNCRAIS